MSATESSRFSIRRNLTLALMVAGYAGYYACRSNLPVTQLLIADDLAARGVSPEQARLGLGAALSLGTLAYALGKPCAGPLADRCGGRVGFLGGMVGSIACTVAFGLAGSIPAFTLIWAGNRLAQSFGWAGMIKVVSRWFGPTRYSSAMGVLSLSFLWGDAAARFAMGRLMAEGLGWRAIFLIAAGTLAALLAANAAWLRESPTSLGFAEPDAGSESVYGARGDDPRDRSLGSLLGPLLRSPSFGLVCLLSLGLTLLREAFNTWTPTYFAEGLGMSRADAAGSSAWFPLAGGASVLLAGWLGDRLGRAGRAVVLLVGLALAGLGMTLLGLLRFDGSLRVPVALVAGIAFCLLGPYSYLAGAISLDLGGKRGAATASGLVDFAGYLGGSCAGWGLARVSLDLGWRGVFLVLAGVAWTSVAVAVLYLLLQRRARPIAAAPSDGITPMYPNAKPATFPLFDRIARLFAEQGDSAYFGEPVTQSEHALQAAQLAEQEGASDELIVAALLHDIGHLVTGHDEQIADEGVDARHEDFGASWLADSFGPAVIEPIRLHVAAKRYLCAIDPPYADALSDASKQSLALQGGPFDRAEVAAFEANPHHLAAVRLRRWDDTAKVAGLAVPGLDHYRGRIEAAEAGPARAAR